MNFPQSQITAIGIKVTTVCKLGGIGLGYILPDDCYKEKVIPENLKNVAWQSRGNGFYYPKEFVEIVVDGGKRYINTVKQMCCCN